MPSLTQQRIFNLFGELRLKVDNLIPEGEECTQEELILVQVLSTCMDDAYARMCSMLRAPLGLNVPYVLPARPEPVLLELTPDQLYVITDHFSRLFTPGSTLLLIDDGNTFQALLNRNEEGDARHLFASESLQNSK